MRLESEYSEPQLASHLRGTPCGASKLNQRLPKQNINSFEEIPIKKLFSKIIDRFAAGGTILFAMGCAACFPALGSLGATLGLGFLSAYEGMIINVLLPVFASIALTSNLINWLGHRRHIRGTISILGPIAVLATLYPLWKYNWSTYLFYGALALMFAVALADLVKPVSPDLNRR